MSAWLKNPLPLFDVTGKVAIVTGASGAFGSLAARVLAGAGAKLVLSAGKKPELVDPETGEIREVELFVAVLGASNYTFAEATATQQLPDWIGAHCRAFAFFNGVSQLLVPDNTRTGVRA